MSKANAAARDAALGFEGRWSGQAIIECTGVTAPLEIIVEDGDMRGELIVRGQGQGDGKYFISGYIDRKGRLSDGRMMGPFRFSMRGKLSGREGKGEFYGPECSGNWKLARAGTAPLVKQEKIATSAPTDDAPPVIVAPGDLQTERWAVELVGRVSDASKIIEFTVNGTAAPLADDGSFQLQRGVAMGQSELVIADSCYSGCVGARRPNLDRDLGRPPRLAETHRRKTLAHELSRIRCASSLRVLFGGIRQRTRTKAPAPPQ